MWRTWEAKEFAAKRVRGMPPQAAGEILLPDRLEGCDAGFSPQETCRDGASTNREKGDEWRFVRASSTILAAAFSGTFSAPQTAVLIGAVPRKVEIRTPLDHTGMAVGRRERTRGGGPTMPATNLPYLAIRNARIHWRRPVEWTAAMGQFAILFEDRFPTSAR